MIYSKVDAVIRARYQIEDVLAVCGQACVTKAIDLSTGEPVVLRQQLTSPGDPGYAEESARFAELASVRVFHPNVVETIDAFQEQGQWVHVQRFIEGQELKAVLTDRGRLAPAEVITLGKQLSSGLGAIHAAGLVHRDVKPANIMVDDRGDATIIDLGISKRVWGSGLTRTGAYVGTVGYSAPEQVTDSSTCDARADLFGLGVVLYECLTGRRPFTADTPEDYLREVTSKAPLPARSLVPNVPCGLSDLCSAALSAQRVDRPSSAREFSELLGRCVDAPITGSIARCLACGGRAMSDSTCTHCGRVFSPSRLSFCSGPARDQTFVISEGNYTVGRAQLNPHDRSISRRLWRVFAGCGQVCLTQLTELLQPTRCLVDGELVYVGQSAAIFSRGSQAPRWRFSCLTSINS